MNTKTKPNKFDLLYIILSLAIINISIKAIIFMLAHFPDSKPFPYPTISSIYHSISTTSTLATQGLLAISIIFVGLTYCWYTLLTEERVNKTKSKLLRIMLEFKDKNEQSELCKYLIHAQVLFVVQAILIITGNA